MKILLTGKNGQVGFELQRSLAPLGELIAVDTGDCNLADVDALRALIDRVKPQVIVNPAAYTAVDKAESEPQLAAAINGAAPGILGQEAKKIGALVVHYSTDYVFDGAKSSPYLETDLANPLNVYGASKWAGEQSLAASGAEHLIFRTSWVFGARGANFVKTMLKLATTQKQLRIVADQFGAPTSAALIADVTAQVLGQFLRRPRNQPFPSATYHLTAAGRTSWHGFAQEIIGLASAQGIHLNLTPSDILPISTAEYPLPASRPMNSCLDTAKLRHTFGLELPDWRDGLRHVISQLG